MITTYDMANHDKEAYGKLEELRVTLVCTSRYLTFAKLHRVVAELIGHLLDLFLRFSAAAPISRRFATLLRLLEPRRGIVDGVAVLKHYQFTSYFFHDQKLVLVLFVRREKRLYVQSSILLHTLPLPLENF